MIHACLPACSLRTPPKCPPPSCFKRCCFQLPYTHPFMYQSHLTHSKTLRSLSLVSSPRRSLSPELCAVFTHQNFTPYTQYALFLSLQHVSHIQPKLSRPLSYTPYGPPRDDTRLPHSWFSSPPTKMPTPFLLQQMLLSTAVHLPSMIFTYTFLTAI